MQFNLFYKVYFLFLLRIHGLQNSCITLPIIQSFATISNPSQMVRLSPIIKSKIKLLPSVTQIYKFTASPNCYNAKQPHLSPRKITLFIKFSRLAQRCTSVKHVIPGKTRAAAEPPLDSAKPFITSPNAELRPTA